MAGGPGERQPSLFSFNFAFFRCQTLMHAERLKISNTALPSEESEERKKPNLVKAVL